MSRAPHTRTTVIFSAERTCTVPSSPPTMYSQTDYSLLIGNVVVVFYAPEIITRKRLIL